MISSSSNAFLSLFGWTFVPDFATGKILGLLAQYNLIKPYAPGSPQHRRNYAYTFAFVVLGYLLYTMVQSARAMPPNFYQILGVSPDVDDNGLKIAFRQFAKRNHPDRPGVGIEGAELFMKVRDVFEALKDPVKRFAYDRFGPDVLHWTHCKTPREFLRQGLMQSSGYHIISGAALLFWSAIGRPSPVAFWRYLLFASLFAAELSLLLAPSPAVASLNNPTSSTFLGTLSALFPSPAQVNSPTILHILFPQRITQQHVLFLHQLFMFLSVALSRVAPQLFPPEDNPQTEAAILERTKALASLADRETSIMLHTDLRSILPSHKTPHDASLARPQPVSPRDAELLINELSQEMEDLIIEANIKKDAGPLRSAWEAAVRRVTSRGTPNKILSEGSGFTSSHNTSPSKPRNFWESENADTDTGVEDSIVIVGISDSVAEIGARGETVIEAGDLPSPRPSPPPPPPPAAPGLQRKGSSFVRARSISY
ncbi:hypothetical protein BDQ12DRAFT_642215 [Crucibulum laeve]|uniref:J domain-containing protein n=1 Tax=Crucibulum laeve TaxID=68775 RepID=A0A5C3MJH5_9AGAR|nr:hypothetical protein BDQ12DRAFT_642215 [Crucibulum laeve]